MRNLHTLLKAPGGKWQCRKMLHGFAPFNYDEYREPFCYSAAMSILVPPDKTMRIGDVNPSVYGFWHRFKTDPAFGDRLLEIADRWKRIRPDELEAAKTMYREARQTFDDDGCLESFWTLSRVSMGAVVFRTKTNFSPQWLDQRNGFRPVTASLIRGWRNIIGRCSLHHADYRELLHRPGKRVWAYLDPPYIQNHPTYANTFTEEDHRQLASELARCKHRFLATVGKVEKPIYEGYGWRIRPRPYSLKLFHNVRRLRGMDRDYIITNY